MPRPRRIEIGTLELARSQRITRHDLAERLGVRESSVSRVLGALCRRGLIVAVGRVSSGRSGARRYLYAAR